MADLIDRNSLTQYPIRIDHYDKKNGNIDFVLGIESIIEFAEALPAADAVEVVRCKECKFTDLCICVLCEDGEMNLCSKMHRHTKPDDFCSYGERKETE